MAAELPSLSDGALASRKAAAALRRELGSLLTRTALAYVLVGVVYVPLLGYCAWRDVLLILEVGLIQTTWGSTIGAFAGPPVVLSALVGLALGLRALRTPATDASSARRIAGPLLLAGAIPAAAGLGLVGLAVVAVGESFVSGELGAFGFAALLVGAGLPSVLALGGAALVWRRGGQFDSRAAREEPR